MKKKIVIKITLTDGKITLDGQNLDQLTTKDVVDSIKVLGSMGNDFEWLSGRRRARWKCVNSSSRFTRTAH